MNRQLLISAVLLTATVFGDDLTTLSGKKYTGVTVTRVEPNGISISHDDGLAKILFTDLSEELRTKHGYDPKKAGQFSQMEQAAAAQRAATAAKAEAAARIADAAMKLPAFRLRGKVERTRENGLLVFCPQIKDPSNYQNIYNGKRRPGFVEGKFFLTGHPKQGQIVDVTGFDVDAVEDGIYSFGSQKVTRYKVTQVYPYP